MGKLFKIVGFLPYIMVIFLNAFVDLGHKIIIQNTIFKTYDDQEQIILTAIVNALILLPFIMLFTPAGFLADKYPKNRVIRASAFIAVCLTSLITLFYYLGWFWAAFSMTFLLAVQSAIYSPSKFGFIREMVGNERLSTANGLVQAVTMVAILSGTFAFSIMFENRLDGITYENKSELIRSIAPVGWFLILGSLIELALTFRLPQKQEVYKELHFDFARYTRGEYLKNNLSIVYKHPVIWLSIIGLSFFWAISQVLLASFPAFAKETMNMIDTVKIQGMMSCAGIGIMLGSITSGKFSKNHIETGLLPIGAIGVAVALMIMPNLNSLIAHSINFLALGFLGGLFIVPLNALIQFHAKEHELGIVLAGNNFIQTSIMLGFLVLTVMFAWLGMSTSGLLSLLTVVAFIGAGYTLYNLPQSFVRMLAGRLISSKYRLQVQGFDNVPESGGVLMLGNHISFIDWAILQMASPRPIRFVMARNYYERWYLKWFLDLFGAIPISRGNSKSALELITKLLNKGEVVALFPEGVISRTGQLAEFKHGYEKAAAGADGVILPFHLRGLWGSRFSRSSDKLKDAPKSGGRRDLTVAFGKPLPMTTGADEMKQRVCDLSIESWEAYSHTLKTLPSAWLEAAKRNGSDMAVRDSGGKTLSNTQLITASISLSQQIKSNNFNEQHIGLLLPTSTMGMIANLAVLLRGKTVVNLSHKNIDISINKAEIKSVYTSRVFLQTLNEKSNDISDRLNGINIFYLEDLNDQISSFTKIKTQLAAKFLPTRILQFFYCTNVDLESPAAILFSSKKESTGIVLSHRNLMANLKQVAHVLNTEESDIVMATLPLSHAFGLTVTTFMPLIESIPVICLPDPANAEKIAKAIARNNATVLITTSTFLDKFNRDENVNPLMLESLRVTVAGAEKLDPEVREGFKQKFNQDIYEGYGITETSPVASVNVPDKLDTNDWKVQYGGKAGTVGMPLPGTSFKIVDPETMKERPTGENGLILIGGPQVMLGYLNNLEKTDEMIIEKDDVRWLKTNDRGYIDQSGFLTIDNRS